MGDEEHKGIRIHGFDSGGPGAYSQLLIMREYMIRMASDRSVDDCDAYPADHFEMMGGVGFGGLTAFILGYLRMNVDQAIDALLAVASAIFPSSSSAKPNPEANLKNLRGAVEDILQARQIPLDRKMNDKATSPSKACKVALYAATMTNLSHPNIFRTYPSRTPSLNPTIIDAICATMATPLLFSPVKIGQPMREQSFVGGAVGSNNPTRELLKEAGMVFGKDRRVALIISIGCGRSQSLSLDESMNANGISRLIRDLAADCEIVTKELSTRLYAIDAYLRLNVDRGMENVRMEDWDGLGPIESHTNAYVGTATITAALEASLKRLNERVGTVTLGQINYSSNVKVTAKTVPAVCPCFVLRNREWDIMVRHLLSSSTTGQKIFCITGMGGCGKTQMVSYFLREYHSLYHHIVFVDAGSSANIKTDLEAWARSLGEGHEHDMWEDALRILAGESKNGRWTLVLDNADDPTVKLVTFFPKSYNGTIIITSQNRDVGILSNTFHLEMGRMKPEEALLTLLRASQRQLPLPPDELKSAHTLVSELGRLAVALVQAGTYCRQLSSTDQGVIQPYTFTNYLRIFYSQPVALMTKSCPSTLDGYERGVYTTFQLSYQAIPEQTKEFLHTVSQFPHSDIPLAMLAAAAENSFKDPVTYLPRPHEHKTIFSQLSSLLCTEGKWNELQVQETIKSLRSFSLISTAAIADSLFIQVHPLIRAWVRDMVISNPQVYHMMANQIVTSCCVKGNFRIHRFLIPHINAVGNNHRKLHINDQMAVGDILMEQGHYHNAEIYFEEALKVLRVLSKDETQETLRVAGQLVQTSFHLGRWDEAEKRGLKVLKQRRKVLGHNHQDTIGSSVDLSIIYHAQGRWDESERLDFDVLEQRKRTLGVEHPTTIRAKANLAVTYSRKGMLDEAEKLQLEVLDQARKVLGAEHPDAIQAAANLADTYSEQGRIGEAETLQLGVLEQQKILLGLEHPETIRTTANLACIYAEQERWAEADALLLQALEQRRRILGERHPGTIRVMVNLADSYMFQGRLEEAERLLSQAVKVSIKAMGQRHHRTQAAITNLVRVYKQLGESHKAQEAEKLLA